MRNTPDSTTSGDTTPDYMSYLVRLWRTPGKDGQVWRASLEAPITQEVCGFDDLPDLFAFLLAQTGQGAEAGASEGRPERRLPVAE